MKDEHIFRAVGMFSNMSGRFSSCMGQYVKVRAQWYAIRHEEE